MGVRRSSYFLAFMTKAELQEANGETQRTYMSVTWQFPSAPWLQVFETCVCSLLPYPPPHGASPRACMRCPRRPARAPLCPVSQPPSQRPVLMSPTVGSAGPSSVDADK